jgi:hypothetical protein
MTNGVRHRGRLVTVSDTLQPVVKVRRRTETGEAPRRQAGVPAARTVRGGVEGATTENTGSI